MRRHEDHRDARGRLAWVIMDAVPGAAEVEHLVLSSRWYEYLLDRPEVPRRVVIYDRYSDLVEAVEAATLAH